MAISPSFSFVTSHYYIDATILFTVLSLENLSFVFFHYLSSMASSTRTWKYNVFPSFSGEDVRKSFLSHLLEKLRNKLINTFIDNDIERSRPIGPELKLAIRESRISIVIFSKKYASSTWCLDELVEIHQCFEHQMVIPVFYEVDPSHVRKQTEEFGKAFTKTCVGKTEVQKQRWIKALTDVANIAGYDFQNWDSEAEMTEEISKDVSNKLLLTITNDFGDFVGIDAHIESINSMFCLETAKVKMVGIVGPSGIGKTTIARALFSQLSSQFQHRSFREYKRTIKDDFGMKLDWEEQLLSDIFGQKDLKLQQIGVVKQRLRDEKVLIVLDDVNDPELLKTLAGKPEWFGNGSIIIVITQNRHFLKSHKIDLVYEVEYPSEDIALEMLCQSAFEENSPPDGFMELAVEVAKLAGNLPLGLSVLGKSLRGRDKKYWEDMMPRIRNSLDGDIKKTLRVSYEGLSAEEKDLFLYIACLFNGSEVDYIKDLLGDSVNFGLEELADKSLIHIKKNWDIRPPEVQMHILLETLGRDIVRMESEHNPGKRRFLLDAKDISDVFEDNIGTDRVRAISCNTTEIDEPLSMDKESFKQMYNLQFLKIYKEPGAQKTFEIKLNLPEGLVYLPRQLRLLHWDAYPAKYLPSDFKAEHLVELIITESKLEKLWEGTKRLRNLKKMNLNRSKDLKEIPDLSKATNLETLDLSYCTSLVSLPSTIQNLKKLTTLRMRNCSKLEGLPSGINLESLTDLNLNGCARLRSFPTITKRISKLKLKDTAIDDEKSSLWIEKISRLTRIDWTNCLLRCMPSNFRTEHLISLDMRDSKFEKLWEGVQPLENITGMYLSRCKNLTEIPNLSKATNLETLELNNCTSLVMLSTDSIRNLHKLETLEMRGCTRLEDLPTDINLVSLKKLNLGLCSRLRTFPQFSTRIVKLYLYGTSIEEIPSWIENMSELAKLNMRGCKRLKNISAHFFKLRRFWDADFSNCVGLTSFSDESMVARITRDQLAVKDDVSQLRLHQHLQNFGFQDVSSKTKHLKLLNCFNLDGAAQELILQSYFPMVTVLPGGEVPTYFTHRAWGSSLSFTLPQSSLSQQVLRFKVCIVVEPLIFHEYYSTTFKVDWHFRGVKGMESIAPLEDFGLGDKDHLVVFKVDYLIPFGFENEHYFGPNIFLEFTCIHKTVEKQRFLFERIKGCGIRVLNASPAIDANALSSETEYNQQSGENCDEYRVALGTYEEPSNSLVANTGSLAHDSVLNINALDFFTRMSAPDLKIRSAHGESLDQMTKGTTEESFNELSINLGEIPGLTAQNQDLWLGLGPLQRTKRKSNSGSRARPQ